MLIVLIGSLVLSAATAFLIGRAYLAAPGTFLRSKKGVWLLIILGVSFLLLPPQMLLLPDTAPVLPGGALLGVPSTGLPGVEGSADQTSAISSMFVWPATVPRGAYIALWLITTLIGLLVGMRIWAAGKPGWKAGGNAGAFDTSAGGRARALLPMADSLADVLDALARAKVDARGAEQMAPDLRLAGGRFANELPPKTGDVYQLVAAKVPASVAAAVTRHLLEGAGRDGEVAQTTGR